MYHWINTTATACSTIEQQKGTTVTVTVSPGIYHHGLSPTMRNPYGATLVDVPEGMRGEDVLRHANLDWTVAKGDEVFVRTPLGDVRLPNSGQYALDGGVPIGIGAVGPDFGTIQHTTLFEAGEYLISEGLAKGWSQAGHVGYSKVFGLLELTSECRLDDQHSRFLLLSTGHDGTAAAKASPFSRRLFCTNQYGLVWRRGGGVISIPHKKNGQVNADRLASSLLALSAEFDRQDALIASLEVEMVTRVEAQRFVEWVFPDTTGILVKPTSDYKRGDQRAYNALVDKRADLTNLIFHAPTMNNLRYSGHVSKAVLFHSVVEWSNYYSPTRSKVGRAQEARGKRMLLGTDIPLMARVAQHLAA